MMTLTSMGQWLEVCDLHTAKMRGRAHNVMTMHEPVDHVDTGLPRGNEPVRLDEPDPRRRRNRREARRDRGGVPRRVLARGVVVQVRVDGQARHGCPGAEIVLEG